MINNNSPSKNYVDTQNAALTNKQNFWLPNNYMKKLGTCMEDCSKPSEWIGRYFEDMRRSTEIKFFERGSILLDVLPTSGAQINKPVNIDITNKKIIAIAFYVSDMYAFDYARIHLSNNASDAALTGTWSNRLSSPTISVSVNIHQGWNFIKFHKDEFTVTGEATWGVIRALRIAFNVPAYRWTTPGDAGGGFQVSTIPVTSTTVGIGGVYLDPVYTTPKFLLNFDDSQKRFFDNGFPELRKRGVRGTLFLCKNNTQEVAQTGTSMTIAEHNELYYAGWDIGNHSKTHRNAWSIPTYQDMYDDYAECREHILSNGWTRAANIIAFPGAAYDSRVLQVARDLDCPLARGNRYAMIDYPCQDGLNYDAGVVTIPTYEWANAYADMTITKTLIDKAITYGSSMSWFTHGVYLSNVLPNNILQSDLLEMVDYILAKQELGLIEFATYSEFVDGMTIFDI